MENDICKAKGLANASPLLFICFDCHDDTSKLLIDIWDDLISKIKEVNNQ